MLDFFVNDGFASRYVLIFLLVFKPAFDFADGVGRFQVTQVRVYPVAVGADVF